MQYTPKLSFFKNILLEKMHDKKYKKEFIFVENY